MIEQPEGWPGASSHRELGLNLEKTIGLIVLAIRINGTVEKSSARIALWPDFQSTVGHGIVLGGITGFVPYGVVPNGGIE